MSAIPVLVELEKLATEVTKTYKEFKKIHKHGLLSS